MSGKRKIKFRAWDRHLGVFHEDIDFLSEGYWDRDGSPIFNFELPSDEYEECEETFEENFVIQQFTGLLDKLGKEVYEGDILIYRFSHNEAMFDAMVLDGTGNDPISVVEFKDGAFRFKEEKYSCVSDYVKDMEVIGNIFENPELLIDK